MGLMEARLRLVCLHVYVYVWLGASFACLQAQVEQLNFAKCVVAR